MIHAINPFEHRDASLPRSPTSGITVYGIRLWLRFPKAVSSCAGIEGLWALTPWTPGRWCTHLWRTENPLAGPSASRFPALGLLGYLGALPRTQRLQSAWFTLSISANNTIPGSQSYSIHFQPFSPLSTHLQLTLINTLGLYTVSSNQLHFRQSCPLFPLSSGPIHSCTSRSKNTLQRSTCFCLLNFVLPNPSRFHISVRTIDLLS